MIDAGDGAALRVASDVDFQRTLHANRAATGFEDGRARDSDFHEVLDLRRAGEAAVLDGIDEIKLVGIADGLQARWRDLADKDNRLVIQVAPLLRDVIDRAIGLAEAEVAHRLEVNLEVAAAIFHAARERRIQVQ